jgi:hypothetical protein
LKTIEEVNQNKELNVCTMSELKSMLANEVKA